MDQICLMYPQVSHGAESSGFLVKEPDFLTVYRPVFGTGMAEIRAEA